MIHLKNPTSKAGFLDEYYYKIYKYLERI